MESPCNVGQAFSRQALLAQLVESGERNLQLLALFHIGVGKRAQRWWSSLIRLTQKG